MTDFLTTQMSMQLANLTTLTKQLRTETETATPQTTPALQAQHDHWLNAVEKLKQKKQSLDMEVQDFFILSTPSLVGRAEVSDLDASEDDSENENENEAIRPLPTPTKLDFRPASEDSHDSESCASSLSYKKPSSPCKKSRPSSKWSQSPKKWHRMIRSQRLQSIHLF